MKDSCRVTQKKNEEHPEYIRNTGEMILINDEAPSGKKLHTPPPWNRGTGYGEIRLFHKEGGKIVLQVYVFTMGQPPEVLQPDPDSVIQSREKEQLLVYSLQPYDDGLSEQIPLE